MGGIFIFIFEYNALLNNLIFFFFFGNLDIMTCYVEHVALFFIVF